MGRNHFVSEGKLGSGNEQERFFVPFLVEDCFPFLAEDWIRAPAVFARLKLGG